MKEMNLERREREKEAGSTNFKKGSLRSGEAGYNNPLG
jgi:hypothetical protein